VRSEISRRMEDAEGAVVGRECNGGSSLGDVEIGWFDVVLRVVRWYSTHKTPALDGGDGVG
jgi:hypothetical protein